MGLLQVMEQKVLACIEWEFDSLAIPAFRFLSYFTIFFGSSLNCWQFICCNRDNVDQLVD